MSDWCKLCKRSGFCSQMLAISCKVWALWDQTPFPLQLEFVFMKYLMNSLNLSHLHLCSCHPRLDVTLLPSTFVIVSFTYELPNSVGWRHKRANKSIHKSLLTAHHYSTFPHCHPYCILNPTSSISCKYCYRKLSLSSCFICIHHNHTQFSLSTAFIANIVMALRYKETGQQHRCWPFSGHSVLSQYYAWHT